MIIICNEEISKLKKLEESEVGGGQSAQQRDNIHSAVADDVVAVFKGKTVRPSLGLSAAAVFILLLFLRLHPDAAAAANGGADQREGAL